MKFNRVWASANKYTFDIVPIGNFVRRYLVDSRVSIDVFARDKQWALYTNDLNEDTRAEYHMDALEFLEMLVGKGIVADLVILDPPYSLEQAKRSYESIGVPMTYAETHRVARWIQEKHLVNKLLELNGIVLSFGWHTNGMGRKRGYQIEEILLVCHGSAHNDTICMAERKLQSNFT